MAFKDTALQELAARELARRHFDDFSRYVEPSHEHTQFHVNYAKILDAFAHGLIKNLTITVPPQHGKSEKSTRWLPCFLLGLNPELNIVIGSYSQTQARRFNRKIQENLDSQRFRNVFPDIEIPRRGLTNTGKLRTGDETEILDANGNIKVVGRGAGITGNPCDVLIVDDPYKDLAEAYSPIIRDNAIDWYTGSLQTRLHNDSQQLFVFTRWHEEDLQGFVDKNMQVVQLKSFAQIDSGFFKSPATWAVLNFPAVQDGPSTELDPRPEGEALWPTRHSLERLELARRLDGYVFASLFQGKPKPAEGLLYREFQTYSNLPPASGTYCYTDTADKGTDYLCSIFFDIGLDKSLYVRDILYTDEPMETTEPLQAAKLVLHKVTRNRIESNNGGRGFARSVERHLKTAKLFPPCWLEEFTQTANKEARILSNATLVQEKVRFPADWIVRFPRFATDILSFRRNFNANVHDDAADALTGAVELYGAMENDAGAFEVLDVFGG